MVSEGTPATESPLSGVSIDQLIAEIELRPDFRGVVAWSSASNPNDYKWHGKNCSPGHIFLQLAERILCHAPVASAPTQN